MGVLLESIQLVSAHKRKLSVEAVYSPLAANVDEQMRNAAHGAGVNVTYLTIPRRKSYDNDQHYV
ncbi:hypothetical protein B5M42_008770 [Paenibacillus athensensis]|uniref:Uncharacterized protein n=1 Tax=Paenibacillus athensensis TaxID=1967502 RepID=A0A4Y8Q958_9BACL|nr:hypothetical protein [Paenibacillus athensensis]MCD1258928.1 hypothetical protein [Paenibacillus athensensis]